MKNSSFQSGHLSAAVIFFTSVLLMGYVSSEANDVRNEISLNTLNWKFKRGEVKNGYKTKLRDDDWLSVTIPHDYNGGSDGVHDDVFSGRFDFKNDLDQRNIYKGPGWYRTEFTVDASAKGKRVFIEFEAVSLRAEVWVNGKEIGEHRGGYTAFEFDVTDYIKFGKPNVLAVRADNSNDPTIAPWMKDEAKSFPYSFDYAVYGGIYRDVTLRITDEVRIEKVFNTPVSGAQAPTSVTIETYAKNYGKKDQSVALTTIIGAPDGSEVSRLNTSKQIAPGEEVSGRFPGHFAWVAFDFASPRAGRGNIPIPFMNQKGLVLHDHETKKDVYYLYQSMYRDADDYPMVHIGSHSRTNRWRVPAVKDVWMYSNCDSVALHNGLGNEAYGFRTKTAGARGDTRMQWDSILITDNLLYAEGWHDGRIVAHDTLRLDNLRSNK